jgi:hypothetical protein
VGAGFDKAVFVTELRPEGAPLLSPTTPLPEGRRSSTAARVADRVVSIGGQVDVKNLMNAKSVYVARIAATGTLEDWLPGPPLENVLAYPAAIAVENDVYLLGGYTTEPQAQVLRSTLKDGALGPWQKMASLTTPRDHVCAAAAGRFIYAVGGVGPRIDTNERGIDDVAVSTVLADGTLGPWIATTKLPRPLSATGCAAF